MKSRNVLVTVALLAALTAGQSAQAGRSTEQVNALESTTVRVDDLNLRSASGARRLNQRIDAAVARVCRVDEARSLNDKARSSRCRDEARERALRQVAGLVHAQAQMARDEPR